MRPFTGVWTPEDRAASIWPELPFAVPAGTPGLRITLDYDRSAGVLDLGLIDPDGWRGWSGGARSVVEIGPDAATPGYENRGLPAGEWRVVLGLHRIPNQGLPYRVDVELATVDVPPPVTPPVPQRPPRRTLPAVDGLTWLAGDLHAHTLHSDGALSIAQLAALAVGRGLDFLAVTDHNTVSHHPMLPAVGARYGIDLLPGQEVTTADGHANAFGAIGWVDFRRPADDWVRTVAGRGGLLSINHPIGGDCAWRQPLTVRPPLAEVWHSSWTALPHGLADGGPLAWWAAAGPAIAIGGSDWHRPGSDAQPGTPTTWVAAADGDVLGALAAGRVAISAGRDAPVLLRLGDELHAVDADAAQLVCPDGRRTPVRAHYAKFAGHPGPHLLERNDRTLVAIAN